MKHILLRGRKRSLAQPHTLDFLSSGLLVACWTAGCSGGIFTCSIAGEEMVPWMLGGYDSPVSIVRLFLLSLFPFLISAYAVSFGPWLLYLICWCKGFLLTFTAGWIVTYCGGAGRLVYVLMLFRSWAPMPFLIGFWLSHISGARVHVAEIAGSVLLCALLAWAEYCFISPLLGRLIVW